MENLYIIFSVQDIFVPYEGNVCCTHIFCKKIPRPKLTEKDKKALSTHTMNKSIYPFNTQKKKVSQGTKTGKHQTKQYQSNKDIGCNTEHTTYKYTKLVIDCLKTLTTQK